MRARKLEEWWYVDIHGCWIWLGQNRGGYGLYWYNGKQYQAHRFVYEKFKKIIASGLHLDHKCRNRLCVNPDHMEEVNNKENCRRGKQATINIKIAMQIRDLYKYKIFNQVELSKIYPIAQSTISELLRDK